MEHIIPRTTIQRRIIWRMETSFRARNKLGLSMGNVLAKLEVMKWAQTFGLDALSIKIDFEKAYDHMEWFSILAMLQGLSFGPRFLHY
jgi:hypothetical protein